MSKSRVVTHHVDFLFHLGYDLALFLGSFDDSLFALRLLEIILIVLSKDVAKVNALVDQGCLDQLQSQVHLIDLSVLMLAEQLAHEKNQVQVLRLFLRSMRVVLRVRVCESIGHDIEEELKTVPRDVHFGSIEGIDKLIAVEVAVTALICSS